MEDLDDDLENHQTSSLGNQTHHVRKIKLKSILNNYDEFQPIIQDAVFRIHDMVVLGYQFLRCFILEKYEDHIKIDRQFMYNILKSVTNKGLILYKENDEYKPIFDYYNQTFRNYINVNFNNKNLSFLVQYASIEMNTCFENNLMLHFKDYLNKYLNLLFLVPHKEEIKQIKDKNERNEKFRNIKNDLTNMKLDLYTNSTFVKYEGIHKEWLDNNRNLLVPKLMNDNINYHLKTKSYDFIKYSIYINKEIENLGFRPYQIVPQRNNNVPKNITLDHAGIVDLLGNKIINMFNKEELNNCCIIHELKNIENDKKNEEKEKKKEVKEGQHVNKNKKERKIITLNSVCKADIMLNPVIYRELLFNTLFIKKNKIFSKNKKLFNYTFKTDGVSVSLDFVNYRKNKYEESKKGEEIKPKRTITKKNDIDNNKDIKPKRGRPKKITNNKVEQKKEIPKKDEIIKKEKKSKKVNNTNHEDLFKVSNDDFIELEKLNEDQINKIKNEYIILGCDPGKKDLCTLIDQNNNMFQYSACRRRNDTFMKNREQIQNKEKSKYKIQEIEKNIDNLSARTLDINKYIEFIKKKNEINLLTKDYYHLDLHRNIKFKVYCNTLKSEANLLNEINNKYNKSKNKKIAIGYGNWSQSSQMKNFFSTPCVGFRRLIHSKFLTITVDEFKTSCKYHKDGSDLDNYKYLKRDKKTKELLKDKDGKHIEISCHKLLTYESTNPTGKINRIFIDRDRNGSKNILQCFINKLSNIPRPQFLTRN